MSKRLVSVFLGYGVLAGLIVPAGLLAQQETPAPAPASPPVQQGTATLPQSTPPAAPGPTPAPPAATPAAPAPQPPPASKPPPPKTVAVAPIAVASAAGSVTIKDFQFGPASVTVNVGDSVTWTNSGPSDHTATASDGSFDTGTLSKGRSASHTFGKAGTFAYVCSIHPNMHGTVRVVGSSSNGGNQGGSAPSGNSGSSSGSSSSSPSSSDTSGSSASLPATGVDAGGLMVVGLGFLALGAFARRRTVS